MQLDDTKHKVYIYNIDDELSDTDSDHESGGGEGKLVFLPDIEKHLQQHLTQRIPRALLDPRPDPASEAAGKELVLYSVPSSLTVPAERDSVRRAILEARQRAREKLAGASGDGGGSGGGAAAATATTTTTAAAAAAAGRASETSVTPSPSLSGDMPMEVAEGHAAFSSAPSAALGDDPDAMDLD